MKYILKTSTCVSSVTFIVKQNLIQEQTASLINSIFDSVNFNTPGRIF
jgi:hypothetical protein